MLSRLLAAFLPHAVRERSLEGLARQVAEQSLDAVFRLVSSHTGPMSRCEVRGYVMARSAAEIRRQTEQVVARHPEATPDWAPLVARRATERIVPLTLHRLRSQASTASRRAA